MWSLLVAMAAFAGGPMHTLHVGSDGALLALDPTTGELWRVTDRPEVVADVHRERDGHYVHAVYALPEGIFVGRDVTWLVEGAQVAQLDPPHRWKGLYEGVPAHPLPDGGRLALDGDPSDQRLVRYPANGKAEVLAVPLAFGLTVAADADGDPLYTEVRDGKLWVVRGGAVPERFEAPDRDVTGLAEHRGRFLAATLHKLRDELTMCVWERDGAVWAPVLGRCAESP